MRTANNRCRRVSVKIHEIDETSSLRCSCAHTCARELKDIFFFFCTKGIREHSPSSGFLHIVLLHAEREKGSIGKKVGGNRFQDGPSECAAETEVHMREREGGRETAAESAALHHSET